MRSDYTKARTSSILALGTVLLNITMFFVLFVVFSRLIDHARGEGLFIPFCATILLASLELARSFINAIKDFVGQRRVMRANRL